MRDAALPRTVSLAAQSANSPIKGPRKRFTWDRTHSRVPSLGLAEEEDIAKILPGRALAPLNAGAVAVSAAVANGGGRGLS